MRIWNDATLITAMTCSRKKVADIYLNLLVSTAFLCFSL